jgi:hypothetical protein
VNETDISKAITQQDSFIEKMKKNLSKNLEADQRLAREKLTQMRLKKKRKLRQARGQDVGSDDDGEEGGEQYVVTLASDGEGANYSN